MSDNLNYQSVSKPDGCAGVTLGAETKVDVYQSAYTTIARSAITDMTEALKPLANINNQVTGYGAEAGETTDQGITYSAPLLKPTWSDFTYSDDFNPSLPAIIDLTVPHGVDDPGDAPDNPYNLKTEFTTVDPFDREEPGDAPFVEDVVIPDPPDDANITEPTLHNIIIKDIVPVVIPEFTAPLPNTSGIDLPTGNFTWSEEDYDSAILQATQSRVAEFLAGGVGIPSYIWDAIWDRGRDKTIRDSNRLITETTNESASKGWSIPTGSQFKRIDEARQAAHNEISEYARELVIKEAEHEIENLKFAVAQGQALEGLLGGWYQQQVARALEAAKYKYQLEVEIFKAQISLFNAEISLFNAQVLQFKTLVEAELSKLEEQKLYLEGQKIIGELNMQEVAIYEANIKAYEASISAYNGLIKGILGKAENNKLKMEGYGIEVQAFGELVKAKTSEYEGLKAEISAEELKVGIFESMVKSYQTEVDAFSTKIDASYKPMDIRQQNNDNEFKKFASTLTRQESITKDKLQALENAATEFDSKVKSYVIDVENEKNRSAVELKELGIATELAGQTTQANIATADNLTKAAISSVELLNKTSEAMARAYSQIAGSAMGVVNVGAQISDRTSNSASCSTRFDGGKI